MEQFVWRYSKLVEDEREIESSRNTKQLKRFGIFVSLSFSPSRYLLSEPLASVAVL